MENTNNTYNATTNNENAAANNEPMITLSKFSEAVDEMKRNLENEYKEKFENLENDVEAWRNIVKKQNDEIKKRDEQYKALEDNNKLLKNIAEACKTPEERNKDQMREFLRSLDLKTDSVKIPLDKDYSKPKTYQEIKAEQEEQRHAEFVRRSGLERDNDFINNRNDPSVREFLNNIDAQSDRPVSISTIISMRDF